MPQDKPGRGRGISAGLNREMVVAAAERIVTQRGVQNASLRAVAVALGVTPGAIYSYVADRRELLDAVADAFLAREVLARLPEQAPPLDALRLICRLLHAAGCAHPALLSAVVGHIPERAGTAQMEIAERMLRALRAAGADQEMAQRLYRRLVALCLGYALHDANLSSLKEPEARRRLEVHATSSTYPEVASYARGLSAPRASDWLDREIEQALLDLHAETARALDTPHV